MQRTKKRPDSMPGFQIGTSYLLVIFIILCLVTFAALALSSALRDQSYSQALAKTSDRIRCRQYTGFCPAGTD